MQILLTGATGFVGRAMSARLRAEGVKVVEAVRTAEQGDQIPVGDINATTQWGPALAGCHVVVHLAARVHVMSDTESNPIEAYRTTNVAGTVNLARQAVNAGVKRFVFVSSVKVNGESTSSQPFTAFDTPTPCDPYGQSKLEAEIALQALSRETGLEVVIVRPPLVYGPGVKANFRQLIKLASLGLPLPLGKSTGRRSMVALDNLVDLLVLCTTHRNAAGGIFMVSDGVDLTVGQLVTLIAAAMNKKARLLPVPLGPMLLCAKLIGKSGVASRLLGSLQVDISHTRVRLEWEPVVTPQRAIAATIANFLMRGKEQ